jgi:uncharacterized protein (TIGR02145 family)
MSKTKLVKAEQSGVDGSGTFTDERDGQTYRTVKIGNQVWMAENLRFDVGDGCWCYENSEDNCDKYGRLYTWDAAKKACPAGYHLPSREEWEELITTTADDEYLYDEDETLKSKEWNWNNDDGVSCNGTDAYGFSALPGGCWKDGVFVDAGYGGMWWSAPVSSSHGFFRFMYNYGLGESVIIMYDYGVVGESYGFSVRCVKDD